jgi:rhodanese-related sulfurtransferase
LSTINVADASALLTEKGGSSGYQWIDVRSLTEYVAGHIPGAVNIPMEQIEVRLEDLAANVPILLICQAGKRARMVAGLIEPCRKDVRVLEGGTAAWKAAGLPLVASTNSRWSLERQVRLVAGLLILASLVLAGTVHPYWLGLTGFVGLGLTFAGATDLCLMAALLVRLPWNRTRSSAGKQTCAL